VLALANKESLVMAGRLLRRLLAEHGGRLIPVDSEHSALYQLLRHTDRADIEALIITASGGPFREYTREGLKAVKPEEALKHPTWKMGRKVTLDSATLMNKGLEVIEARWLFDIEPGRIRVLVHPESIVHGMVELVDGTILVNMAYPDMKVPISYALNEEKRRPLPVRKVDLAALTRLTFSSPDIERFPSLGLAYEALKTGDSAQIVLNAANEVAVTAFMEKKIRFTGIPRLIEATLVAHTPVPVMEDFAAIKGLHEWATDHALTNLGRFND
jgi:1-deoxy-D-xylulose-5-phosphate reductoisomerase